MQNLHYGLIMLLMLMSPATSAKAQVSIGISLPNVSIGINLPVFPELVAVPGYPVYYAPQMDANYFFYDGMYWVYQDDIWYASSWYNGPWGLVQPEVVPLFILRIPVRYYRQPPVYFQGWQSNAAPRWDQHWGRGWEQQHRGWDKWNRRSAPSRAPLPVYQRQYSGDRYPHVEQQQSLHSRSYRYQPRDRAVRQNFRQIEQRRSSAPEQRQQREHQQQKQQIDQRQQHEQQQQKQQIDQRQQHEQQQQKQQIDQRQQREQQQQRQQIDQRQQREQQQQKQQIDQRQQREQQQQKQQIDQRQQHEQQQQAPRVQEREQRQQERGASQDQGRERGQGQNRDDERGRGRDK